MVLEIIGSFTEIPLNRKGLARVTAPKAGKEVAASAKGNAGADKTADDKASSTKPAVDHATRDTADQVVADNIVAEEATADEATIEKAPADEATPDEATADEATADQATADEATAHKATADEAASYRLYADEAIIDEFMDDEPEPSTAITQVTNLDQDVSCSHIFTAEWELMPLIACIDRDREMNEKPVQICLNSVYAEQQ